MIANFGYHIMKSGFDPFSGVQMNKDQFRRFLFVNDLKMNKMKRDDNSLFRAIADQLSGCPKKYVEFRVKIMAFIEQNSEFFLSYTADTAECAIIAAAQLFRVDIQIFCDKPPYLYSYYPIGPLHGLFECLKLSLRNGNHYNSLQPEINIIPYAHLFGKPCQSPCCEAPIVDECGRCEIWFCIVCMDDHETVCDSGTILRFFLIHDEL
jgi:hypothetical protein